jgi:hypothetical protein
MGQLSHDPWIPVRGQASLTLGRIGSITASLDVPRQRSPFCGGEALEKPSGDTRPVGALLVRQNGRVGLRKIERSAPERIDAPSSLKVRPT